MQILGIVHACYAPSMITTNGIWQRDDPLNFSLPLFILQLMIIVITPKILTYIFKSFHQPKIVWEILGGLLWGPSGLGSINLIGKNVFPLRSIMVLQTMANVGVLYMLFLVGVELDPIMVKRSGKKPFIIAVTTMTLTLSICISSSLLLVPIDGRQTIGVFILWSVVISATASSLLARFLAETKFLNSDLGRLSISIANITSISSWILLVISTILIRGKRHPSSKIFGIIKVNCSNEVLVSFHFLIFILVCIVVIRPSIRWIIKCTPEGESFNDFYICLILAGVMISGFITDAIGTHSIFGAFIFGIIIPSEPLGTALIEKLQDFVTTLLLPLFIASSGLRTNISKTKYASTQVFIIILSTVGKVVSTFLVSLLHDMSLRDSLFLAILMNNKGLMELIIINIGWDLKVLHVEHYSFLVIVVLVTTIITTPSILNIHQPIYRITSYKRRTIQRSKGDGELRVLACIHTPRNVPTIISLLETSNPTKKSPICIYALHLLELTGRASSMLIVHNTHKYGRPPTNSTQAQSEHIINAFGNFAQHTENVIVLPLSAISPYSTMHEDICNLSEDKRITFIIVPFHKQQTVDGGMEAINQSFRNVNQNVLANAPCSVGILIDRGLGGLFNDSSNHNCHHIAMLFFGGPDDREALAYARRMADHPNVNLTVVRFLPGDHSMERTMEMNDNAVLKVITDNEREKQLDEDYIRNFMSKSINDKTITYKEKLVNHGEETVATIQSMDKIYDLYLVGRGQGIVSPLIVGLTEWSECPELGAIGDLLASSDFTTTISVLVVQQYIGDTIHGDGMETPNTPNSTSSNK